MADDIEIAASGANLASGFAWGGEIDLTTCYISGHHSDYFSARHARRAREGKRQETVKTRTGGVAVTVESPSMCALTEVATFSVTSPTDGDFFMGFDAVVPVSQ